MKDSQTGSFFAGIVIGGLIGAAIGLILAPETGDEMREHVGELIDARRTAFGEAVNEGRAAAEQARLGMMSDAQTIRNAEGYAG